MIEETLKKMRGYISKTPPAKLSRNSAQHYEASSPEALALIKYARDNAEDAIILAIEYGKALGLRMGRREAECQTLDR